MSSYGTAVYGTAIYGTAGGSVPGIQASARPRICHLLMVEGLKYAWTDCEDIAGTSWIGASDGREIKAGLAVPKQMTIGETDPRTGLLREHTVSFEILDYDSSLAALFRSQWGNDDLTLIDERIPPAAAGDTSVTSVLAPDSSSVDIRGKHIGNERIGPNGERRHWYCTPDDIPPGPEHAVLTNQGAGTLDLAPVYVSDEAVNFAGRRVALYRLVYDRDAGVWPDLGTQYAGGSMVWMGTLRDRANLVRPRIWKLECHGYASLMRKTLNATRLAQPVRVQGRLDLEDNEKGVAVWFQRVVVSGTGDLLTAKKAYDASIFAESITASDPAEVGSEIAAIVENAEAGAGAGGGSDIGAPFTDDGSVSFFTTSLHLSGTPGADPPYYEYFAFICLHEKVWAALGWDPLVQGVYYQEGRDSPQSVSFQRWGQDPFQPWGYSTNAEPPGPGYIVARFTTRPPYLLNDEETTHWEYDNDGNVRIWEARFNVGAVVTLNADAQHKVDLEVATPSVPGQNAIRPAANNTTLPNIGATPVNAMGWWLFMGQIARGVDPFSEDLEVEDYQQVGRCAWRADSGLGIKAEDSINPTLYVDTWEDPRAYGLDHKRMGAAWISGSGPSSGTQLYAVPMVVLGGYYAETTVPDEADRVLTRLMLSSGTGGQWGPTLIPPSPGSNQPSGLTGEDYWCGDLEIADLGLNLPAAAVDVDSFIAEGAKIGDKLRACKSAYVGPVPSEDVVRGLLQPRGWALSLRQGSTDKQPQIGCYSVFEIPGPGEVEVTLTTADRPGDHDNPQSFEAQQVLTYDAPIDWIQTSARHHLMDGGLRHEQRDRATDRFSSLRSGAVELSIEAPDLADPALWVGEGEDNPFRWWGEYPELRRRASEFYAARHMLLTFDCTHTRGRLCGPGTVVQVTDPRPATPAGTYGLSNAVGRVLRQEYKPQQNAYRLTVLIYGGGETTTGTRYFGPVGRIWKWDSSSSTAYLTGPWGTSAAETGSSQTDATGFDEPSWSSTGGTAKVTIYQSERLGSYDSALTVTADVSSVNASANTVTLSSISGTVYRDTDKIMVYSDYDDQAASNYVQALFSVHTDSLGQFGAGNTQGWKLS